MNYISKICSVDFTVYTMIKYDHNDQINTEDTEGNNITPLHYCNTHNLIFSSLLKFLKGDVKLNI